MRPPLEESKPMKTAMLMLGLLAIAATLGGAGLFMLRRRPPGAASGGQDRRMARALAWRVGLSVSLFLGILLAWTLGWIAPTGLPAGR